MYIDGINVSRPGAAGYRTMVGRYAHRKRERFWEIDFARGLCVLLMVFDHLMYCLWGVLPDLNEMFGTSFLAELEELARSYWLWNVRVNVREVVICTFFLLCGVSCTLTRGNFRRAVPLALVAAGISAVTGFISDNFMPGMHIIFGVIHMIACGVFAYAVLDNAVSAVCGLFGEGQRARRLERFLRYLPGVCGVLLLIVYFSFFADLRITDGAVEIVSLFPKETGDDFALNRLRAIFLYVSEYNFESISADYFPLLPYAAVVLSGGILGRAIYHTPAKYALMPLDGGWNKGVCFLGRHSAFIFVTHMIVIPVLLGLIALVTKLF